MARLSHEKSTYYRLSDETAKRGLSCTVYPVFRLKAVSDSTCWSTKLSKPRQTVSLSQRNGESFKPLVSEPTIIVAMHDGRRHRDLHRRHFFPCKKRTSVQIVVRMRSIRYFQTWHCRPQVDRITFLGNSDCQCEVAVFSVRPKGAGPAPKMLDVRSGSGPSVEASVGARQSAVGGCQLLDATSELLDPKIPGARPLISCEYRRQ